jgi:hypothetical protein
MRDIAAQTFALCEHIKGKLDDHMEIEHHPFADFDPERNN